MSNETQSSESELRKQIQSIQPPLPDPSFRERNRKRFTGRIPYDSDPEIRFQPAASRRWLWSGVGVAAAAALAVILFSGSGASMWEVWEVPAGGSVLVNGEEVPTRAAQGMKLDAASRVQGSDLGFLTLGVEHAVSVILAPGTEVTLSATHSLLGKETLHASVREGTAWGSTGPDFPEGGLWIDTDHARIHVSGTTFSVVSGGDSTCVCVLSGNVEVECKLTGETHTVAPNQRLYLSSAGRDARRLTPLTPNQQDRLLAVRAEASRSF